MYLVIATRLSGESSTSIGNTAINKYVQEFIYEVMNLVKSFVTPCGDDSSTGLTAYIPEQTLINQFALFGLNIELKYVTLETLGFLSSRLIKSAVGYQLVRDPIKAFVKLPWCLDARQLH